jgi:hypothetical protein
MNVELVYFDGCPNWTTVDRRLGRLAKELGFELQRRAVTGPEDAEVAGMHGSPTVLVDGGDPFANAEPPSMSCRVYQTPDGPAGSPTMAQLRRGLGASPGPSQKRHDPRATAP